MRVDHEKLHNSSFITTMAVGVFVNYKMKRTS